MTEIVLRAEEHFEGLRDAVWSRFTARHGLYPRDRFEDAYSEWWTREVERAADGRSSRAAAPVAYVCEAVHRVLIDEARARARGLARDEKAALEMVDLDDQVDVAHHDDTLSAAHYEALVHRVLHLVRERLTDRELRVFVWSFLYLQTSERTAAALGLSEPRVKKDRKKVATKVGAEVWSVLSGELSLCAAYDDKRLQAVFELLTDHVEDCPDCSVVLGGVRRGAVAAVAPVELLLLGDAPFGWFDALVAKVTGAAHRVGEATVSMPPAGRATAAVAAVAVTVGGGAAVVPRSEATAVEPPAVVATPAAPAASPAPPVPTVAPEAGPSPQRRAERRRTAPRTSRHPAAAPGCHTGGDRDAGATGTDRHRGGRRLTRSRGTRAGGGRIQLRTALRTKRVRIPSAVPSHRWRGRRLLQD